MKKTNIDFEKELNKLNVRGIEINYYFICKTKLFLFMNNMGLEKNHENVELGKLLHETSYRSNKDKEVIINKIAIDFIKKNKKEDFIEIHEVKKSDKMELADYYQILYYIYYLKKLGIESKGVINYPNQNKKKEITLNDENIKNLIPVIQEIEKIRNSNLIIPPKKKKYCKKCAYYEFCFS
ncbi:CRISPR-associated protein Cas4 [Methanococcus voltae]|uniref:CRISPR-associated exonuclease Cas4 n=1 Tax=Methanococcus voltae (strain ATCC BAA-1334 / A3) TaxID=456320 RepID=D7DSV8_METV3|nr:CRISPR-associated protein Cas4 [Methanococcus voltae]MCS3901892.1 CRISPR-associated exonuclease Cas4 [Methanococcus voltae]